MAAFNRHNFTFSILICFAFLNVVLFGQVPSCEWLRVAGGINNSNGNVITNNRQGDVFVGGYFSCFPMKFDSVSLMGNGGSSDAFFAKYSGNGNVQWAKKSTGGPIVNSNQDLTCSTDNNFYMVGSFETNTIIFGNDTLKNYNVNSLGDIFVTKYDSVGKVIWAKRFGGSGDDKPAKLISDKYGNCYITATFNSPQVVIGTYTFTISGYNNLVIIKLDPAGNVLWATRMGGNSTIRGTGLATDSLGNLFFSGNFGGYSGIWWIAVGADTLFTMGGNDVVIAKYDSSGNPLWGKRFGGYGQDASSNISLDSAGNIYLSGNFDSNSILFGSTFLYNSAPSAMFVSKLSPSGVPQWAKKISGNNLDACQSSYADKNGNLFVTGYFKSTMLSFGTTILTNSSVAGYADIFVAKYNSTGNLIWAYGAGGSGNDMSNYITVDKNGGVYITGTFYSGSIEFDAFSLNNPGYSSVFIAKLGIATGINEETPSNLSLKIYPNPATNSFFIERESIVENIEIKIVNILGEEVLKSKIKEKSEIDVSSLNNGIYFINLFQDNKLITTRKFIKQ